MKDSKCKGVYHREEMKPAPFRYCPDCGEMINPKGQVSEKCYRHHSLRKSKGQNYCPDCGEKLGK